MRRPCTPESVGLKHNTTFNNVFVTGTFEAIEGECVIFRKRGSERKPVAKGLLFGLFLGFVHYIERCESSMA